MGYYSTIEMDLRFKDLSTVQDFMDKHDNITNGPFLDATIEKFTDPMTNKTTYYIDLPTYYVKMGEYSEWIPQLAEFGISGCMKVAGDEPEMWGVRFYGKGRFRCYVGEIEYQEVGLEDL